MSDKDEMSEEIEKYSILRVESVRPMREKGNVSENVEEFENMSVSKKSEVSKEK